MPYGRRELQSPRLKSLEDVENDVRGLKSEKIKLNNIVTWLSDYRRGLDW
jgi:hypothetical protein